MTARVPRNGVNLEVDSGPRKNRSWWFETGSHVVAVLIASFLSLVANFGLDRGLSWRQGGILAAVVSIVILSFVSARYFTHSQREGAQLKNEIQTAYRRALEDSWLNPNKKSGDHE